MRGFLVFLIGLALGGYAMHLYDQREFGGSAVAGGTEPVGDRLAAKIAQWHLRPEDLRADAARGGAIVRSNAQVVGDEFSDARIVVVIKAKYTLDHDLSARDIRVACRDGAVALSGSVDSPELVGRAVALALDTSGVRTVTARLQSRNG